MGGTAIKSTERRRIIKTLVAGATAFAAYNVLPSRWDKPIIEQIFLPAHAQTSGATEFFGVVSVTGGGGEPDFDNALIAHVVASGSTAVVRFTDKARMAIFQINNVPVGNPGGSVSVPAPVDGCWAPAPGGGPQSVRILSYGASAIVLEVIGGNGSWQITVPAGTGTISEGNLTGCSGRL